MRQVMAQAEVGDDVYGEDPGALQLQERMADLLGKEAAIYVPSGTMANQMALLGHCRAGESVVLGEGSHTVLYESGAGAAWSGVQFDVAGKGGPFTRDEFLAQLHPDEYHFTPSALVVLENTHNRSGGRVFPQQDVREIAEAAHERGIGVHLDGARLWNASAATGLSMAELAGPVDTVSVCFSKGLGAPVGSVLAGSFDFIHRARRHRKMLGGGMRQVGILCAAAMHALDEHVQDIAQDHVRARRLAEGLNAMPRLSVDMDTVETNIICVDVTGDDAATWCDRAREQGLLLNPLSPTSLRAVTHRDLDDAAIERALAVFTELQ